MVLIKMIKYTVAVQLGNNRIKNVCLNSVNIILIVLLFAVVKLISI